MDIETEHPFEPLTNETINRWFDHWQRKESETESRSRPKAPTIEQLRKLALAGNSKARRNKKALGLAVVKELHSLAEAVSDSFT